MVDSPRSRQTASGTLDRAAIAEALASYRQALAQDPQAAAPEARKWLVLAEAELAQHEPNTRLSAPYLDRMLDIAVSAAGSGVWQGPAMLLGRALN